MHTFDPQGQQPASSDRWTSEVLGKRWTFGTENQFDFQGFRCVMIAPDGKVDEQRRWVWVAPGYLVFQGLPVEHTFYVECLLAKGFHVAGIDLGPWTSTFGSPAGTQLYEDFYQHVRQKYNLNPKARLVGQSNGGLIVYAWAFRHPASVDRILGLLAVTDFNTWPGLEYVINPEAWPPHALAIPNKLRYGMGLDEFKRRAREFNPIDNLKPLAEAGVKLFHVHGDLDGTVPLEANALELQRRYQALGGDIDVQVLKGYGHSTQLPVYYDSEQALRFLIAD